MMTHGGRRAGCGRKQGSKVQKTADKAIEVASSGIQPIEVGSSSAAPVAMKTTSRSIVVHSRRLLSRSDANHPALPASHSRRCRGSHRPRACSPTFPKYVEALAAARCETNPANVLRTVQSASLCGGIADRYCVSSRRSSASVRVANRASRRRSAHRNRPPGPLAAAVSRAAS
jgi:hypothetical protein